MLSQMALVQTLAPPFPSIVTLLKSLNLSEVQSPHLYNRVVEGDEHGVNNANS